MTDDDVRRAFLAGAAFMREKVAKAMRDTLQQVDLPSLGQVHAAAARHLGETKMAKVGDPGPPPRAPRAPRRMDPMDGRGAGALAGYFAGVLDKHHGHQLGDDDGCDGEP